MWDFGGKSDGGQKTMAHMKAPNQWSIYGSQLIPKLSDCNSNQLINFLVFLYLEIDESVTTEAKLFSHVGATLTFFLVVWSH